MRIGIDQVDGKWPNLALAKLAAWHRAQGDTVEWFNALESVSYDRVFASKVFIDTPDDPYLPDNAQRGGIGYSTTAELPPEVESTKPDWSLWPKWEHDVGFSTRGCVRKCPFCVVPRKEGGFRVVAEFGDLWTGCRKLILHDNNLTAAPLDHFRNLVSDAKRNRTILDLHQGFDARIFTEDHADIIAKGPFDTQIHMAFDHVRDEPFVRQAVELCKSAGINTRSRLMFFVLIGFDSTPEEDLYRVELLRSLDANPFVMKYRRNDPYQKDFARWANRPQLFRSCSFGEYRKRSVA
uniref:Radical SAM superfamily protein n=1 Tax=viral metagenome TaxID=1070528 RepID=A0A6M3KSL6_9ZZZZ